MAACEVSKCGPVYPGAAVDGDADDAGAAVDAPAGRWVAAAGCCVAAGGRGFAATCADGVWLAQPVASAAANAAAPSMARLRRAGRCRPGYGAARSPASRPGTWACASPRCGADVFTMSP